MRRRLLLLACAGVNGVLFAEAPTQLALSSAPAALPAPEIVPDDGGMRDSLGPVAIQPVPDAAEATPFYFQRVGYLRRHHDDILAISYLREIVRNGDILPQDLARAILELADCLATQHQEAESLCWLKIWTELFPARPEFGAVSFRIGSLYTQMGLPDLARDEYYMTLAHTINQGKVQSNLDLKIYTRLTVATLWNLADNEYQSSQWARAAELFARYQKDAPTASAFSLEKAAFLQADCAYQLKQVDLAVSLYEQALRQHPFNPLAPEARLRLYHLYVLNKEPGKAREELQALAWTVRTVWPEAETYWQKQTADLLLALNRQDTAILPPLVRQSLLLPPEGKTWQEALNHYDNLVSYEADPTHAIMDSFVTSSGKSDLPRGIPEETDLLALSRDMDKLLPRPDTVSNP